MEINKKNIKKLGFALDVFDFTTAYMPKNKSNFEIVISFRVDKYYVFLRQKFPDLDADEIKVETYEELELLCKMLGLVERG
jgi:hypothetical protein